MKAKCGMCRGSGKLFAEVICPGCHGEGETEPPPVIVLSPRESPWLAAGAPPNRVSLLNVDWTEGEREHLMTFAGEDTLQNIGGRLRRSYGAVKRELYRHGTSARANQGLFSAAELAKHYQCPYHRVQDLLLTGVLKGKYDKVRHRWQVDIREVMPAVESLLRAPKQTYTTYPPDLGDYRKRHGIRRVGGKEVRVSR
jgi:hypothetical protein